MCINIWSCGTAKQTLVQRVWCVPQGFGVFGMKRGLSVRVNPVLVEKMQGRGGRVLEKTLQSTFNPDLARVGYDSDFCKTKPFLSRWVHQEGVLAGSAVNLLT